jgi:hypothetical protein
MKYDKYIGFDLHQATTVVAVLDAEGRVVLETIVATEAAAVIRNGWPTYCGRSGIAARTISSMKLSRP